MIILRELRREDAKALADIEKEVFGKNAWTEKDFLETIELDYAYYLVAEDEGQITGACGFRNMCGDADITNVCVIPGRRRQGIAEMMLKRLFKQGAERGIQSFTLEVRAKNTGAIKLYEKLGFVSCGVRPGFYDEPKDDAIIMKKNI